MLHLPQMIPEYGTMLSGSLHNFFSMVSVSLLVWMKSLRNLVISLSSLYDDKYLLLWKREDTLPLACSELLTVTAVLEQCVTYAVLLVVWFFPSFFDFQSIVLVPFSASSIRLKSCQLDMHKACRTQAGSTLIWWSHLIKHDASFCADAKLPQ